MSNRRKKTAQKKPVVKKYKADMLFRTDKYLEYEDILSVLFDSQEYVTEAQVDKALKQHLEREV